MARGFCLLTRACSLHPHYYVYWRKSKHPKESGYWKIAKDINNMPDRSVFRNKWPHSKYRKSYLFLLASAVFFLPLNILSKVLGAELNWGLKKKSVNVKPGGKWSLYLARLTASLANQSCVICILHTASIGASANSSTSTPGASAPGPRARYAHARHQRAVSLPRLHRGGKEVWL